MPSLAISFIAAAIVYTDLALRFLRIQSECDSPSITNDKYQTKNYLSAPRSGPQDPEMEALADMIAVQLSSLLHDGKNYFFEEVTNCPTMFRYQNSRTDLSPKIYTEYSVLHSRKARRTTGIVLNHGVKP